MIWTFLIAGELLIIAAGANAVWLLQEQHGRAAHLQSRIDGLTDTVSQQDRKLEAERILLIQARRWIEDKQIMVNKMKEIAPAETQAP